MTTEAASLRYLAPVLGLAMLWSCDQITTDPGAIAGAAANCPDTGSVAAIASVDWASEFGIDVTAGAKIKAGLQAAVELEAFAGKLDADLRAACGGLAQDLGASGQFGSGEEACRAALQAMADAKAKIGANAKLVLDVQPPQCSASMDAMADCVAECDVNVEPGKAEIQCEGGELVGQCDAQCSGSCHLEAAAKCEGTCQGSCSAQFSGKCGGECNGKCDGKTSKGASCAGRCEGSCTANAEGSCGGSCQGTCKMKAAAQCRGECQGTCSVQMKAPRCTGELKPPQASAECDARCDASVQAEVKCTPARVALRIDGAVDAQAAAKYKAAIERNVPAVLKIAIGMKNQALGVAANAKAVVDGVSASIKSIKAAPETGARLTACVAAPFKAALDAALSVRASVNVSVEVQASASASGSAGGKAGA